MFLDAWSIYGSCGLLELEDCGKQDFTVTESQYNDLILDKDGILTQFEIPLYAPVEDSSYIINENGILVGKDGLTIINNSPATKIIFQSKSEDSIILLGDISVYNNIAELIFIAPSIYCNGCKFPGIDKVVFSTTPIVLYSLGIIQANNQIFQIDEYANHNSISIGANGLLSSSVSLYLFSDIIKAFGVVKVDSIIFQADNNVNFDNKVWSNSLQTIVKNNLYFKELYINGDVSVTASKWEISYKYSISGDCYFKGNDYLIPNTQGTYYVGGNLELVLTQDRYQLGKTTAKGNITVTSDYAINISTILSSQSIKIQSKSSISILNSVKANLAVKLISNNDITINGLIESSGVIELNSSNLKLHGKVNAGKLVKIIAKDNINLDKKGAHLFSQGDLLISNLDNGPIALLYIFASEIEIIGNAIIKTNHLHLRRDGNYKIINQDISQASQGNYHGSWKWGLQMTCYQEVLTGDLGTEAKLIIGGDLTYEVRKISNELSKIAVSGKRNFINKEPEIYNKKIDLMKVGNFKCNWAEEKYHPWCVGESRNRLANYCGLNTNGQTNGPIIQSYRTINSVTNFKYNNAISEIKQISIEAVEIDNIEIEFTEQNHKQNAFIDQNLVTGVAKYKTHVNDNSFPEVRSKKDVTASSLIKNGICKLQIKNDTNIIVSHITRPENQDINLLRETLLARDEYAIAPLHWAIDDNDVDRVKHILSVGNKILYEILSDKEGYDQNTPLHAAIFRSTQIQQIIYLKILSELYLLPLLTIENLYQFTPLTNLVLLSEIEFLQLIDQARKFDTLNALLSLKDREGLNMLDLAHYEEKTEIARIISGLMNGEKAEEELWHEIISSNQNIDELTINKIKKVIKDITIVEEQQQIASWQESDILNFQIEKEKVRDEIAKILAVIKRAIFLSYDFHSRTIQIISTLLLYYAPQGRLAEIATGEGKSIIIASFAVIKVLEGKKIDILTSSPVLAQGDLEEQNRFYRMFKITSAENISEPNHKEKKCYQQTIVYGTIASFIGDVLYQENLDINVRSNRETDIIIVDEVDNMFIDQSSHIVMLAHPLSRFEYLEPLLVALWERLLQIQKQFHYENGKLLWTNYHLNNGEYEKIYECQVSNPSAFVKQQLTNYSNDLLKDAQPIIRVPTHLWNFTLDQLDDWANSAITAYNFKLDEDYTFIRQEDGDLDIAPIDYKNTGITQNNMHWSNGLHQFLQIKHNLKISPETLIINFMSNKAFFERYKGNIYGTTGTIGIKEEVNLLSNLYAVDAIKIPTFKHKRFNEEAPIIASGDSWEEIVIASVISKAQNGQAVLLIAKTARQAAHFEELLINANYSKDKIRLYSKNDLSNKYGRSWQIDKNDIVISTALAGRGTDFKTTPELEEEGGVHVCISYLPVNKRVLWQLYGRTSRNGNAGSAQLIINLDEAIEELQIAYPWYQNNELDNIGELFKWNDLAHKQKLLQDKVCETDMLSLKDYLFTQFNQFLSQFKKPEMRYNAEVEQIRELWGIWLKDQQNLIRCNIQNKLDEHADFSAYNNNIKRQALENYQQFIATINYKREHNNLITNPSFLVIRGLFNHNAEDLDQAKNLDPYFSFAANYAKAYTLVSNNDKEGIRQSLQNALANIEEVIIPLYQLPLHLIGARDISVGESPLAVQFRDKINIMAALIENIMMDLNVVAQSQGEQVYLKIENAISLERIFTDYDRIRDEVNELEMMGITHFYEFGIYVIPKEKKGFFGNVFAIAMGLASIAIGIYLPGSTVFMQSFRAGLIVGGIKDEIISIIATAEGKRIEVDEYLKGKGIELAVNVITAGIQAGLDKLKYAEDFGFKSAAEIGSKSVQESFKQELIRQSQLMLVTTAIENTLKLGLDAHRDEIEDNIQKAIHKVLIAHEAEIVKIIALDRWEESNKAKHLLISKGNSVISNYQGKYRQVHHQILRRVAGNIPLVSLPIDAYDIAKTLEEVLEITDEFCQEFGSKIQEVVPSDQELLRASLRSKEHKVGFFDSNELITVITTNGLMKSQQFVHNDHQIIDSIDLGDLTSKKETVKHAFNQVINLEKGISREEYHQDFVKIENEAGVALSNQIIRLVRSGIFAPLAAISSSYVVQKLQDIQATHQDDLQEKLLAARNVQVEVEGLPWLKSKIDYDKETKAILVDLKTEDTAKVEELIEQVKETKNEAIANSATKSVKTTSNMKQVAQAVSIAKKAYIEFSEKYPLLAEHGMRVLNIGLQSLFAGAAGFANALRAEGTGYIINKAAGEEISYLYRSRYR